MSSSSLFSFLVAHVVVMVLFVVLGIFAAKGFRNAQVRMA